MPADRLGVVDHPFQLGNGRVAQAAVEQGQTHGERARFAHRLQFVPLGDIQNVRERLDHPAQRAHGALALVDFKRILDHLALDRLGPFRVPAIDTALDGQPRQQCRRAVLDRVDLTQHVGQLDVTRRKLGKRLFQRHAIARQQAGITHQCHRLPRWP